MNIFSETLAGFAGANGPAAGALACGGVASLLWAALCLLAAGHLKARRGWKTGYTRKLFHFLIFGYLVAEAVSPHGWDNLSLQVLPAWLGMQLLST